VSRANNNPHTSAHQLIKYSLITTFTTNLGTFLFSNKHPCGAVFGGQKQCIDYLTRYTNNQSIYDLIDNSTDYSESVSQLLKNIPAIQVFKDLYTANNLRSANIALKGVSGVYAIICRVTGAIYIGSSMNIANRIVDHLINRDTNQHLQSAIDLYGLDKFLFVLVEKLSISENQLMENNKLLLLAREQVYLDQLFLLPEDLRFNFLSKAGSSLGFRHSEDSKAKMSASKSGENHPLFGLLGPLSHMFGKSLTAETRQRISDALKGRIVSEETRSRLSEAQKRVNRSMNSIHGIW
jgi:group I intron endonuclease